MSVSVLIIDDSSVMRKVIQRSLRQSGIDVARTVEASNGVEGLQALEKNSVDLILCDWNMPEMNGLDFVKNAREKSQTPILMLTTEGTADRIDDAMAAGASAYLTKPFTAEVLGDQIRKVLGA